MNPNNGDRTQLIVAILDDLMMANRIETVARHLNYKTIIIGDVSDLAPVELPVAPTPPGEPLAGQEATLIERLTSWQPLLIVFDLSSGTIPWRNWIAIIKSSPATRRIPVLCFGPHVDKELLETARGLSVETVITRSRFVATMPDLIEQNARVWDYAAIDEACQESLPASALKGLAAFNARHFFESHEYLEEAWNEDIGAAKEVYKAILQVAVAYLQIERANYRGAVKMFLRARQWFAPLPDICRGINIVQLRTDAERAYYALIALGPEGIESYEYDLLCPVQYLPTIPSEG